MLQKNRREPIIPPKISNFEGEYQNPTGNLRRIDFISPHSESYSEFPRLRDRKRTEGSRLE